MLLKPSGGTVPLFLPAALRGFTDSRPHDRLQFLFCSVVCMIKTTGNMVYACVLLLSIIPLDLMN